MAENWCAEKIENLNNEENAKETLNEIRVRLREVNTLESQISNKLLTSVELFHYLDDEMDDEKKNIAADILGICMANLDLNNDECPRILQNSLSHSNTTVRAIALNEIWNVMCRDPTSNVTDIDFIILVMKSLDSEESRDSALAIKILSKALLNHYDNTLIKSEMFARLDKGDIIRCRVYEIVINLAKTSETMLEKTKIVLDKALKELQGEDILLQLNILELFVSLAESQHGLIFLESQKIFEQINKRLESLQENPLDSFLVPGFLKFFGKITYSQPRKMIMGYPRMIQFLFNFINSGDLSILPTAFDTLANVVGSSEGKAIMHLDFSDELQVVFSNISNYLRTLSSDLKSRCFNSLEMCFQMDDKFNNEISEISEKWFYYLAGCRDLQFLFDFVKNPFPDIKVACLSFIKTICLYYWGVIALRDTAGMIEYLLDRRVEFDKDAKVVKYDIIAILSETSVFDAHTLLLLKKYVNEGPHYVEAMVEVAVEGS